MKIKFQNINKYQINCLYLFSDFFYIMRKPPFYLFVVAKKKKCFHMHTVTK